MRRQWTRPCLPTMLEVYVHNLWSMKSFHGVLAGNIYHCLLKTNIGKVSL